MINRTRQPSTRNRRYRRMLWLAAGLAAAAHAAILWLVVLPAGRQAPLGSIVVVPQPMLVERPTEGRAEPGDRTESDFDSEEGRPARAPAEPAPAVPSVQIPTPAPGAPEAKTIPRTALTELAEPLLPLETTPYGIRRRAVERDQGRLARMRAESLVNARIASVVEAGPAPSAGPVSLAPGGGIALAIPWGGFVRNDRTDEAWRRERCEGKGEGKSDHPGEAEARQEQCS